MEQRFLARFDEGQKPYALELLDLGRASYRLRDDDNISLGKIEGQVLAAVQEGRRRIRGDSGTQRRASRSDDLLRTVAVGGKASTERQEHAADQASGVRSFTLKARQILGQPAGQGIVMGKARVVLDSSDLFSFQQGEILVCIVIIGEARL